MPGKLPAEFAALVVRDLPIGVGTTAHDFTSRDKKWTLTLTREYLSLTCRAYLRWEEFKEHLDGPLEALRVCYNPGFFTRIGLRYRDVIRRSVLGLDGVGWDELLSPWIAGVFTSAAVAAAVEQSVTEMCVRLPDERSHVRANHGLVRDDATKEDYYAIDADFFNEQQTEPSDALSRLDFLNQKARLFFRWCIKDRLHEAMGPQPVPPT
jgi:uncharacterized protein (TIGR04255 family)